ncbi:MAG: FAD-dependent thymidylate synthase [Terriglobus sp.]
MSTPLNETDVYAIHGADPEVLAYAMAKYSRSALTLRESLAEISSQKAEQFLNTFYFQYGHRSIADLAHVAFAIERLSLLAAISLVDEQRWDGQERSTRYQNFRKSGWYTPTFETSEQQAEYTRTIETLFDGYTEIGEGMLTELKAHSPRPEGMDEASYTRTLRARAYDMARYLLPLATNTSLGQITNARTLENQIARLLGSDYEEIRTLGNKLRDAASGPAWQVNEAACSDLVKAIGALEPEIAQTAHELIRRDVHVSPTLVKYTTPSEFEKATRPLLEQAAAELMLGAAIEPMPADSPNVELITPPTGETLSLEIDLAASLLYPHTHYRFRQIRNAVASLSEKRIAEIIDLGLQHRGRHDELPRAFAAANGLRFDILMDIGGFRDMHRHRRCTQLIQPYTTAHGYEIPDFPSQPALSASPVFARYTELMQQAFAFHAQATGIPANAVAAPVSPKIAAHSPAAVPLPHFDAQGIQMKWGAAASDTAATAKHHKANPHAADYVLPLATRCRSLFTMDFAEALYISELRSTPAGHWSYRSVAWQMYSEVAKQYPALAKHFRIRDPHEPIDLLVR